MLERHIIWFRTDLRVHDNAALSAALASGGDVIPMFIFDSSDWTRPERSRVQFDMVKEAVSDLQAALAQRGAKLLVRTGDPATILADIHHTLGLTAIHMHHETSDTFSLMRDRRIAQWCVQAGISLRVQDQHGVRAHGQRETRDLNAFLRAARKTVGDQIRCAPIQDHPLPEAEDFGLGSPIATDRAEGGRGAGVKLLNDFIGGTARDYPGEPSEHLTSRLSPHLTLGTLSIREVWQRSRSAAHALRQDGDARFATALDKFAARIEQRSHLLQRVENQTALSGRGFDETLPSPSPPLMEAFLEGRTGFPIIDASIRKARRTGWLPYQYRTLLAVFAVRTLWLDPALAASAIGRLMGDYSPALNRMNLDNALARWPRLNLVSASRRLDPFGELIAAECPPLAALPATSRHAPWDAPKTQLRTANLILGQAYPMPVVDHVAATRNANPSREMTPAARLLPMNAVTHRSARRSHTVQASKPVQLSFDLDMPTSAIN